MTKVVDHSRARDTSTISIQPGIHNIYTPNTRKQPLLCSIVPRAIPSLPVLFRVCIEYSPATLIFLVRFLSELGLSSPFDVSSTPKSYIQFRPKPRCTSQQTKRRHNNTRSTPKHKEIGFHTIFQFKITLQTINKGLDKGKYSQNNPFRDSRE